MNSMKDIIILLGFILTVLGTFWAAATVHGRVMEKIRVHDEEIEDLKNDKVSNPVFEATVDPIKSDLGEIKRDVKNILSKLGQH